MENEHIINHIDVSNSVIINSSSNNESFDISSSDASSSNHNSTETIDFNMILKYSMLDILGSYTFENALDTLQYLFDELMITIYHTHRHLPHSTLRLILSQIEILMQSIDLIGILSNMQPFIIYVLQLDTTNIICVDMSYIEYNNQTYFELQILLDIHDLQT